MHAYLVISPDSPERENLVTALIQKEEIDPFDITFIERGKGEEKKAKASLGIEDIKIMQKKLYLKPFRGHKKAIIIKEAHVLTTEAQNALLKVLEEPPENTILILSSASEDVLLPTVRSRVSSIRSVQKKKEMSQEEKDTYLTLLKTMMQWEDGQALKQAEQLAKNKDEALIWLENMILIMREQLLFLSGSPNSEADRTEMLLENVKKFQQAYKIIKTTNVNLRLTLENTLLR